MPMEHARYPANWTDIAQAKKEAAKWTCDRCGKPCFRPGEKIQALMARLTERWIEEIIEEDSDRNVTLKPGRFALTVAHLDQNPGHNAPSNHAALCAPCHLKHQRQANSKAKLERQGQGVLFGAPAIAPELAGDGRSNQHVQAPLW